MTAVLAALAALPAGAEKQYWTELQPEQPASATTAAPPAVNHGLPNLSALVERASPAVVSIIVEEAVPVELDPSDPLHDFFDRFYGDAPNEGLGTGFVIDPSGLIVTNSHVVEHARKIRVILEDDGYPQELEAEVVGRDPETDLALLQVQVDRQLPVLPLGNSDEVQTADWVVAIGNPFGLAQSVTFGIVSQINRSDVTPQGRDGYFDFIQTDASINPGNSGGPLLNLRGEVVAVNNAINASGQGIGFAVPINMAKAVIPQLAEKGEVQRAWIGLSIQDVTVEVARSNGMKRPQGVVVSEITADGPAARAGLRKGDVIVSWNGKAVRGASRLRWDVACSTIGAKVPVQVLRDGKIHELAVEPGVQPKKERASLDDPARVAPALLGLELADPTQATAIVAGSPVGAGVEAVAPEGRAARAGLQPGDLIVGLGSEPVRDAEEFAARLAHAEPDALLELLVRRAGQNVYVALRMPPQ